MSQSSGLMPRLGRSVRARPGPARLQAPHERIDRLAGGRIEQGIAGGERLVDVFAVCRESRRSDALALACNTRRSDRSLGVGGSSSTTM